MTIQTAIFSRATSDHSGLSALISTRCYQRENVPQSPTVPYMSFEEISNERTSAMGSDTGDVAARYQMSSWSTSKQEARSVADQVRQAFQRYRATIGGTEIKTTFIDSQSESFESETKLYQIVTDVFIHYVE